MILRRIAENLKQQHWTSVFIELVIVVLGVFIGLQVDDWSAERATRQRSAIFTARLRNDLAAEAWGVRFLTEYNKEVLKNADLALRDLSGEVPMSDEQFVISAYRATQFVFQNRYRATYDELVSTGELGLVADQLLRRTAVVIYTTPIFEKIGDNGRDSEYRRRFRLTVPHDVQDALLKRCGDRFIDEFQSDISGLIDYPCTLDLPAGKIVAAAKALRDNQDVGSTLRLRFADIETNLQDLQLNNPQISRDLMKYEARQP